MYPAASNNKTNTIKQLWNNFNKVYSFSKHSKKQSGISKLISNNNTIITDPKDISNYFNNYFCSIGDKLSALINCPDSEFKKFCDPAISNSIYCEQFYDTEVINIVNNFNNCKSPGPDNIGPKLLKCIITDVIRPLLYILIYLIYHFQLELYRHLSKLQRLFLYTKREIKLLLIIIDLFLY